MLKPIAVLASLVIAGDSQIANVSPVVKTPVVQPAVEQPVVEEVETVMRYVIPGANPTEMRVLRILQDRGITDKNALATIMGNIKQESRFHANICEGGARVQYQHCHTGGYGLIQWTTQGRYDGLGRHARNVGYNPSSVDAQVSYIFTERQWASIENNLKRPGNSIGYYMNQAYRWLGWGHHGRRTQYSHSYASRMVMVEQPK